MAKRVSGIEDDVILLAGLGVGGYLLYQHFFAGPSQDDNNKVTNLLSTPDTDNPLSYKFKYSLYAQQPTIYNANWWINLGQEYATIYASGQNPADYSGVYNYVVWAEIILGAFGYFTVDFASIQSVIQQVNSQADVANIASYLYFGRDVNLHDLLFTGKGSKAMFGGLSTTNFATLINEINALPESN